MSIRASREPPELQQERFGLRFANPSTEDEFRAWHRASAVSFARFAAIAGFVCSLTGLFEVRFGSPDKFPLIATWVACTMWPMFAGLVILCAVPRLHRWVLPASVALNAACGCLALGWYYWIIFIPDVAYGWMIIISLFAFLVYRLPPLTAALSALVYLSFHQWLVATAGAEGRISSANVLWYSTNVWAGYAAGLISNVVMYRITRLSFRQERIIEAQQRELEIEQARADKLLLSILPQSIADRLKQSSAAIADRIDDVTVLFADVVGFTPLSARLKPEEVVAILNELFTLFDRLAEAHGVEKIKTIGDAYMAVGGVPLARGDHAEAVAALAMEMQASIEDYNARLGASIKLRIGICSGPVVAGVIGLRKFAYDLWGDTVNTAARMEAHGVPGEIQVSESTWRLLAGRCRFQERGMIEIKGKGPMPTWFLKGPLES